MKAQVLDRILKRYFELQYSAFYSRNWVELAEVIEREAKLVVQTEEEAIWGQRSNVAENSILISIAATSEQSFLFAFLNGFNLLIDCQSVTQAGQIKIQ